MATGGALGRLNVILGLDSAEFTRGLSKSEHQTKQSFEKMERQARVVGAALAAVGVAAGTAFVAWTAKMADTGRELDRFATLTNTSAETFQRWAYGAKTVGIEQEKLSDILKDVQDRVGDFITTGGGPMADFFEQIAPKIGLTAEQFRNLSGPDALQLYVSSLEKAGLSQSEMIFYMEAMASDSSLLIPLLKDNASGMRAMGDEAERLGAIMSDQTVAAAKELDINFDRLKGMLSSVSMEMANNVIPVLNDFISNAIDASVETDGLRGAAQDLASDTSLPEWIDTTLVGFARIADVTVFLGKALNVMVGSFNAVRADLDAGMTRLQSDPLGIIGFFDPEKGEQINQNLEETLANRNAIVEKANNDLADLWTYQGNKFEQAALDAIAKRQFDAGFVGPAQQLDSINVSGDYIPPSGAGGRGKKGKKAKNEDPLGVFIKDMNIDHAMSEYQKYLDFIGTATGRTLDEQNAMQKAWLDEAVSTGEITAAEFDKALEYVAKNSKKAMSQMDEFAVQAARNIQQSLGDGLYGILTGSFDDIGARFGEMILRMAADAAAANLAGAMFGDYGKTGQIGGIIGNIAGSLFGGASAPAGVTPGVDWTFASGGYTGPGGKHEPAGIVHKGEYVLSQDATRRIGVGTLERMNKGYATGGLVGGGSTPAAPMQFEVNLTNAGGQQMGVQSASPRFDGEKLILDVLMKDLRTNGPYARQLKGVMA